MTSPPAFREVLRHRAPEVVARLTTTVRLTGDELARAYDDGVPLPRPAPSAAVEVDLAGPGPVEVRLSAPGLVLAARRTAGGTVVLTVEGGGRTTTHLARRRAARLVADADAGPTALALTLTGHHAAALVRVDGAWVAQVAVDLHRRGRGPREDGPGTVAHRARTPATLAALRVQLDDPAGSVTGLRAGGFGHLGLRDVRAVTTAEGDPLRDERGRLRLTATHAGTGFFGTAHCGAWALDPVTLAFEHTGDLWTTRHGDDRVLGDHAVHVVRDHDGWLVATSTWGDFDEAVPGATVGTGLARTVVDPLVGEQVLATDPWPLPTTGLTSVGTWDPHLVRDGDRWLVAFVTATRFFRFGPALAAGPSLDALELVAVDGRRTATEGVTLVRLDGAWRVLAADGPDSPARLRRRWPVLDLDLREVGTIDGPFPTNIPWPTVVPLDPDEGGGWLVVTFDGTPAGGPALGYGTHGDLVVLRSPAEV